MMLWKKLSELTVTKLLRFGKNAVMRVVNADGTETTLDLTELAALDSIGAADLAKIDGITNGAGAAGKALVLDSNGDVDMPDGGQFNVSADTLAAAGTGQSDAAVLVDQLTVVTGADGATGVALPAAADLEEYTVVNNSPTYALKVYPVNGGDDVINELGATDFFVVGPGRKATFKAISATQWYVDMEASRPHKAVDFEVFDDFLYATIDTTDNWIVFAGTDGDADAAAVVTAPEGQVVMGSGDGAAAQDGSVLSLILLAKGALVSLGKTVFECRVSFDQLTGVEANFGLSDTLATDNELLLHTIDTDVVADGGLTVVNTVEFGFSSDADSQNWQAVSENADTIGNSGGEDPLSAGPVADTYDTLRIEVDEDGTARYYLNGVLETTRTSAVATTALLIPYIGIDAGVDAQVVTDLTIDYIRFSGARPSSNA